MFRSNKERPKHFGSESLQIKGRGVHAGRGADPQHVLGGGGGVGLLGGVRGFLGWKPTMAKWITATFAIPLHPSSIKPARARMERD